MRKLIVLLLALTVASPLAMAVPVTVVSEDTPSQDPLILHQSVHELGIVPFPAIELISATATETPYTPCSENPDTAIPNIKVTMTNLTTVFWHELVYVADPETTLTNDDGLVNGRPAFNIDWVGANIPLVGESIAADTIFAPGETWEFVIQDYFNGFALPASAFGSVGLVGAASGGDSFSSGSIIAVPVPEPLTLAFLGISSLVLVRRRRR